MSKNLSRALDGSPELIHTEMAIDRMLSAKRKTRDGLFHTMVELIGEPEPSTEDVLPKLPKRKVGLTPEEEAALRAHRHPSSVEDDPAFLSVRVLLLKINQLEEKVDRMSDLVRQLSADHYPRYVGTREACKILGIGSTTMDKRLQAGYYPFAVKENGRWRFSLAELYRFAGQL